MIVNLTQHPATPDQIAAGVTDLPASLRERAVQLLTFPYRPDANLIESRAELLVELVHEFLDTHPLTIPNTGYPVMIGCALWLVTDLEAELLAHDFEPVYAFSRRLTIEMPQADGSVRKVTDFRHNGFVRKYREQYPHNNSVLNTDPAPAA